jgi:hypothetical protein
MAHPRPKGLVKALLSGLLIAGAAWLVSTFDPFGVESNSARFSADIAQYIASPFYGRGFGGRAPVGQQKISVVYVDEAGLEQLSGLWKGYPPSFAENAQLLVDVAAGAGLDAKGQAQSGPRAVFVDWVFLAKGRNADEFEGFIHTVRGLTRADAWRDIAACHNDELIKLACIRAAGGLPVILAGDKGAAPSKAQDAAPDLLAAAVMGNVAVNERSYPLLGEKDGSDSPAALLYAADCLAEPQGCPQAVQFVRLSKATAQLVRGQTLAGPEAAEAAALARRALSGRFAVTWSAEQAAGPTGAAALQTAIFGQAAPCRGAEVEHPALHAWAEMARRTGERLTPWRITRADTFPEALERAPAEQPCNYALSVPYGYLVTRTPLNPALRERLFSNKLVLVGGQYIHSNDWIRSPVLGLAPGVQYHAMALDNLLEAKSRGRAPHRIDQWTETLAHLFAAGLILVMVFLGGLHRIERNDRRKRLDALGLHGPRRVRTAFGFLTLYLRFFITDALIIIGGIYVAMQVQVPTNWVAVTTIVLGHGLWSVRDVILDDLRPIFEAWPTSRAMAWAGEFLSLDDEVLHRRRRHPPAPPSETVPASSAAPVPNQPKESVP